MSQISTTAIDFQCLNAGTTPGLPYWSCASTHFITASRHVNDLHVSTFPTATQKWILYSGRYVMVMVLVCNVQSIIRLQKCMVTLIKRLIKRVMCARYFFIFCKQITLGTNHPILAVMPRVAIAVITDACSFVLFVGLSATSLKKFPW